MINYFRTLDRKWLAWACQIPRKIFSAHCRVRKGKGTVKESIMNTTEFLDALREQRWMLYVPERVYRAHRDGLLRGWGISGYKCLSSIERTRQLLQLFEEQGINLRLPLKRPTGESWQVKQFMEECADRVILHGGEEDYPPFPELTITSDALWDAFVSNFDLTQSRTNRMFAWRGWVYSLRFFPLWAAVAKPGAGMWPPRNLSPVERKEWHRGQQKEVRAARRVLREDYGLTGEYFGHNNTRRAILAILKKAYPPEQVRRVRRQLEDRLRKDPAEVIRCALERELVM